MAVERRGRLSAADAEGVRELVGAVADVDGSAPLSEHVLLHLRYGGDEAGRSLLVRDDGGTVVGYLHLDVTDPVEGPSAELAVHPDHRGRGLGSSLVRSALEEVAGLPGPAAGRLRLWAHGEQSPAAALARSLGFERARVLWQMRRSLIGPLPAPAWPAGVTTRTFVVGRDEQEWTAVNNRAFADHPEQGGWGVEELRNREREDWFDPEGFILAERDGHIVGFHWTKVHGATGGGHGHGHEPIGEVYVVGVDPSEQGRGLGPALTLAGLRHLRRRGLSQAMLYVDESNTAAIAVYERLGFTRWDTDTCFAHR